MFLGFRKAFDYGPGKRDWERRIDGFYSVCEKILLRTLMFGCFVKEFGKFAKWLLR